MRMHTIAGACVLTGTALLLAGCAGSQQPHHEPVLLHHDPHYHHYYHDYPHYDSWHYDQTPHRHPMEPDQQHPRTDLPGEVRVPLDGLRDSAIDLLEAD